MNPEPTLSRKPLHLRRIEMQGYERSDGLFEVEGRLVDTKPHEFHAPSGTRVTAAGESIHEMVVMLVVDGDLLVKDIQARAVAAPYRDCYDAAGALKALVGQRIGPGWNREVKSRLGGPRGCTHTIELLVAMASAAFQSLSMHRLARPDKLDAQGRPVKLDSCYAYRTSGEQVLHRWPQWYQPRDAGP